MCGWVAAELGKNRTRHVAEAHAKVVAAIVGVQIVGRRKAPYLVGLTGGTPLAGAAQALALGHAQARRLEKRSGLGPLALGVGVLVRVDLVCLVVGWQDQAHHAAGRQWRLDWKVEGNFALRARCAVARGNAQFMTAGKKGDDNGTRADLPTGFLVADGLRPDAEAVLSDLPMVFEPIAVWIGAKRVDNYLWRAKRAGRVGYYFQHRFALHDLHEEVFEQHPCVFGAALAVG